VVPVQPLQQDEDRGASAQPHHGPAQQQAEKVLPADADLESQIVPEQPSEPALEKSSDPPSVNGTKLYIFY
jgi:hypothetical protein